jgi:hypothetical protein
MAKERGLRSSNDAKPWKCRCGTVNHPKKRRFSDVPSWECRGCKREVRIFSCRLLLFRLNLSITVFDNYLFLHCLQFKGDFKFCLGEIEVDGGSLIGDIWDQEDLREYFYSKLDFVLHL